MRELWYFIRYFAIYIHFVRGVLIALTGIVILCAILLMLAEGWGFGDSLYAAGITALTIGYGDITPKTIAGRVISVVIGLFGILYTGPRLSGSVLLDKVHGVDSSVFRTSGNVLGHGRRSTPCGIRIAYFTRS